MHILGNLRTSAKIKTTQRTFTKLCGRTSTNMQKDRSIRQCRNADLRKFTNIRDNQKQKSEHLRTSASEHQRTCRRTEIRRNADLRTSTNIREHQKQNSEHLRNSVSEHQRTCRTTTMPIPSPSLRHRPHNTSHLPISSYQRSNR